jgi:hypothetical protein
MLTPIPIDRISPPSSEDFLKKYSRAGRPVIITGLTSEWAGMNLWTPRYFVQKFGDAKATSVPLKGGKLDISLDEGVRLKTIALRDCVAIIEADNLDNSHAITMAMDNVDSFLESEYQVPAYCKRGRFLKKQLMISPRGVVTPLHQDLPENLFVMLRGKKHLTLFSPLDSVYPHSRFSRLPNYSQIDVFEPDYSRFPKLKNAQPYTADLAAGETLFIPSFWWHHVHHVDACISLAFWWSHGWKVPVTAAAAIYAGLRKMGNYSA